MMILKDLVSVLDNELQPSEFRDYCPKWPAG